MGKINEISQNLKQSFDCNDIEVNILQDKVVIDSNKKVIEINNTLRATNVEINGVPSECFTSAEKEKLNKISTPMQVVGRLDSVELLPTDGVVVGSVYLVGLEGSADFEEYIVISSNPTTYESLGKTQTPQIQADWNQTTSTESDYIKNKPTKLSDFINDGEGGSPADSFVTESEITDVIETTIEVNGLTIGIQGTSADVVTKLLGSDWRLPTLAEYQELLECCTVGHTRQGGFDIPIVTSNTTHNILRFVYYNNNYHGSTRLTSNVDSVDITKASTFYANAENWTAYTATIDRYRKVAIRPVTDNPNLGVDMGCPSGVRWASRDLGATTDGNTGNQYAFGEITTKAEYTWGTYLCAQAECGTPEDPLSHVTKPVTYTVLHKDNTAAHLNPVKEARWDGKQDALGFTPENVANKKTSLDENSDTYYPTQKAVKTALDAKADKASQVQSDWNQSDSESPDFLKNKPFYEDFVDVLVLPDPPANGTMYFEWGETVPVVGKSYTVEYDIEDMGILVHHTEIGIGTSYTQYSPEGVRIVFTQGQVNYNPASFSLEGHNVNGKFEGNPNMINYRIVDSVLQKIDSKYIDGYMAAGTGVYSNKFNKFDENVASGDYSHAEGYLTSASGDSSHAEGSYTKASGSDSHAEGAATKASGNDSHAEGYYASATGFSSHAEGNNTTASGAQSHAEGNGTTASGTNSHAEGIYTTANHKSQHVFGESNILDPSTNQATARGNYVEIVGNGTNAVNRSNARTLDWNGNEVLAGGLTCGGDVTANGVNISAAISTVKFQIIGTSIQASSDGGLTWHTITFAD